MIYGPSRLFVSPTFALLAEVLLMQLTWIAVMGILLVTAYRRGVAHLAVNGG
jgi:ABC-type uncharacterized transport system permease subunit